MISFIVPTIGRPSLAQTVASIECWPGDEIIIIGDVIRALSIINQDPKWKTGFFRLVHHVPGGDWGHTERNFALQLAHGKYTAHIDDDDTYVPGTRALMADAMSHAESKPILFKMQYPNGIVLWAEERIRCGNVGTPMMLIPNEVRKLGTWGSFVGGDCHFLETSKWAEDEYVWRPEVIAKLGHNT